MMDHVESSLHANAMRARRCSARVRCLLRGADEPELAALAPAPERAVARAFHAGDVLDGDGHDLLDGAGRRASPLGCQTYWKFGCTVQPSLI